MGDIKGTLQRLFIISGNDIKQIQSSCTKLPLYSKDINGIDTLKEDYNNKINIVIDTEITKTKDILDNIIKGRIEQYKNNKKGPYDDTRYEAETYKKLDGAYLTKISSVLENNNLSIITKFCGNVMYIENLFNLLFEINKLIIRVLLLKYSKIIQEDQKAQVIKGDCKAQETELEGLKLRIRELELKLIQCNADKTALEQQIVILKHQIRDLTNQIASLQQTKAASSNVVDTQRYVDEIKTLKATIEELRQQLVDITKKNSMAEAQLVIYRKQIINCTTAEDKLQKRIKELEEKLANSNNYIDKAIKSTSDIIHRISSLVDINELSSSSSAVRRSSTPSVLQQQSPRATALPKTAQPLLKAQNTERPFRNRLLDFNNKEHLIDNDKSDLAKMVDEEGSAHITDLPLIIDIIFKLYKIPYGTSPTLNNPIEFASIISKQLIVDDNLSLTVTYNDINTINDRWICFLKYNNFGQSVDVKLNNIVANKITSTIANSYSQIIIKLVDYINSIKIPSRSSNKYLKYKNKYLQLKKLHNL
jgi:hypothetical protein